MGMLMKYALTGVLNTVLDYAIFGLLNAVFGVHYLIAQTISYAVATINSYLVNRSWTFRSSEPGRKGEWLRFLTVNLFTFGISTAVLAVFHGGLGWNTLIAKGIAVVVATGAGFAANKYWVFRVKEASPDVTKVSNSVESGLEKP